MIRRGKVLGGGGGRVFYRVGSCCFRYFLRFVFRFVLFEVGDGKRRGI